MRSSTTVFAFLFAVASCNSPKPVATMATGTTAIFDLDADLTQAQHFYDYPYPSDLRLTASGAPDWTGFPNPQHVGSVTSLLPRVAERKGFPVLPSAWFKFTAPIGPRDSTVVIPAKPDSPVLLIDIDTTSPDYGVLVPTVAATPEADNYVPDNLLAVAARPGFILRASTRYAFVILRSLDDATKAPLGLSPPLETLKTGGTPAGTRGAGSATLYAPLWPALDKAGVVRADVAAATVFTTGDVVADTFDLSTKVLQQYSVQITGLAVDADGGQSASRLCKLVGKVTYPQFQEGTPPFNTQGAFSIGADGLPVKQRDEDAPVTISLPNGVMPAKGYPLEVYFHGSGGLSTDVVDRGPMTVADGPEAEGRGPAWVLAPYGIAAAGSALPLNPERFPNASDYEYLNFDNLGCFRDNFRQGVIEQRLFIEALRTLQIPAATVAACSGLSLPAGATAYQFDPDSLVAQGQSMGGMYTNLVSAVEPRIKAVVPTGAGGYWSYFILYTQLIPDVNGLIGPAILGTGAPLTFMHPAMHLFETAVEAAEPFVHMVRLARRPLPNHPARSIYEPVGTVDSYFPTQVYDAAAIAYGNQEAGDAVWPTMQDALALDGRAGILPYPIKNNRTSDNGSPYTGVIVQYQGQPGIDAHYIYAQLDAVKYQYGCFLSTFLATGSGIVGAPLALGMPCPN